MRRYFLPFLLLLLAVLLVFMVSVLIQTSRNIHPDPIFTPTTR